MHLFCYFCVHKASIARSTTLKLFDRDSILKICLLPGLEAQKVEKHWSKGTSLKPFKSLTVNLLLKTEKCFLISSL